MQDLQCFALLSYGKRSDKNIVITIFFGENFELCQDFCLYHGKNKNLTDAHVISYYSYSVGFAGHNYTALRSNLKLYVYSSCIPKQEEKFIFLKCFI